ncbi:MULTISPECIES: hypothetical protein [Inquilinus]|uniref:Uncharacterized protein n=1 Tax=Inquilinus ginsengisoli TaxID=363840 RepID=A0ABU1JK71_9PROT|nr:hypothetical protein [Inquilinus ginsengisoli]MDR6289012.1 hypothetical protein [Inquilinus ginsengisoli]
MSAFVVVQEHIDELVSAAIDLEIRARLVTDRGYRQVNHENANDFGRMLWAENIRSVIHRYRLSGTEEAAEYEAAVGANRFTWRPVPPGRAAKRLACFEYQACECEDWEESLAYDFGSQMARALITKLPGYAEAPW